MKFYALILMIFLGACSGPELPLAKPGPLPVDQTSLVRPPWEALVKAGPGAENDVDFETLNGPKPVVAETPEVVDMVEPPAMSSPKSDAIQIKAVAVPPVKGKGASELTAAMRKVLIEAGWPVVNAPRKDTLIIQGEVVVDPAQNGQQLVHLAWLVSTPKGVSLGDIKQANPVPAGSLDSGWGENAGLATQAAAGGIFKLIEKYR